MRLYSITTAAPLMRNSRTGGIGLALVSARWAWRHKRLGGEARGKVVIVTEDDIARYNKGLPPMKTHERPRVLIVSEAAEYLGISERTMYRELSAGILRGQRVGDCRCFCLSELDEYLAMSDEDRHPIHPRDNRGRIILPEPEEERRERTAKVKWNSSPRTERGARQPLHEEQQGRQHAPGVYVRLG